MNILIVVLILSILWLICNLLLVNILRINNEMDELSSHALNNRRNVFFDIMVVLCVSFFKIKLFYWCGIIGYGFMALINIFLLGISIFVELPHNKKIIKYSDIPRI